MIRYATAALVAASGTTAASAGMTLFSQPRQPGSSAGISLTEGGNAFGFADRRLADNFTLGADVLVDTVRWWGGSETSAGDSLSNIAGFQIAVYADDGGLPGTAVFTENVSLAAASATAIPGETQGLLSAAMYGFSVDLSSSLALDGGTDYWISIAADVVNPVDFTNEAFQWVGSSVPSDGIIAQDRFDGAGFQLRSLSTTDFAFELIGVPAPGAAALFAFAGIAAARRRR